MKKILSLLLLLLLVSPFGQATTYTWIRAKMNPISINNKGEILARTHYEKNSTGADDVSEVQYGLAIIADHKITEFITHRLAYPADKDYDKYYRQRSIYEQQFNQCRNKKSTAKERLLRKKYGFTTCNVSKYRKDIKLSLPELKKQTKADIEQAILVALHDGKGHFINDKTVEAITPIEATPPVKPVTTTDVTKPTTAVMPVDIIESETIDVAVPEVMITYDFGNIVLLNNIINVEQDLFGGIEYDYQTGVTITTDDNQKVTTHYDFYDVTGIWFLDMDK